MMRDLFEEDYTGDEMHEWLLAHADKSVMEGADSLCWDDRARWATHWPHRFAISLVRNSDDEVLMTVLPNDEDFSTTAEFWTEVES